VASEENDTASSCIGKRVRLQQQGRSGNKNDCVKTSKRQVQQEVYKPWCSKQQRWQEQKKVVAAALARVSDCKKEAAINRQPAIM